MPPHKLHRPVFLVIVDALGAIFGGGQAAERVVEETLKHQPKWGARDRRTFAGSVYELVRWWRREAWRAGLADDAVFGPAVTRDACIRVWAAWWQSLGGDIPDFPETAEVRQMDSLTRLDPAEASPAIRASFPEWLHDRGEAAYGPAWPALRDALNAPAAVWLRVNRLRTTRAALVEALCQEGLSVALDTSQVHPDAVRLADRPRLAASPSFKAGLFEVQDAGSQQIAPFLQPQPGEIIIDSCAGAGGKSLHLAALMRNRGRLIAMDIHPWKLDALSSRAARAGVDILETRPIDASASLSRWPASADRLLIDAPCSGLGVLRRHPDTKWKISPPDLDRLVRLQHELLDSHSRLLKPGGTLVYATCSFLPEENGDQIRAFLARQPPGAWRLEEEALIRPDPSRPEADHDAFYMARLRSSRP